MWVKFLISPSVPFLLFVLVQFLQETDTNRIKYARLWREMPMRQCEKGWEDGRLVRPTCSYECKWRRRRRKVGGMEERDGQREGGKISLGGSFLDCSIALSNLWQGKQGVFEPIKGAPHLPGLTDLLALMHIFWCWSPMGQWHQWNAATDLNMQPS